MSNLEHTIDDESINHVLRALKGLQYGSVQIVVHDWKITQIERTEKHRFPLEKNNDAHHNSSKLKRK